MLHLLPTTRPVIMVQLLGISIALPFLVEVECSLISFVHLVDVFSPYVACTKQLDSHRFNHMEITHEIAEDYSIKYHNAHLFISAPVCDMKVA